MVNDEEFSQIVAIHLATMLHLAITQVGQNDAEDVTQEAITRAWKTWGSLSNQVATRAWLLKITLNVCYDWRRGLNSAGRRAQLSLEDLPYIPGVSIFDPGASNHNAAIDLRAAIKTLPEDLREVIFLRFFVGLDASEISHLFAIPASTIRARIRRSITLLRETLTVDLPERSQ
jgi:RNA polymerase sigma-70 factor, ECF subfamily